MYIMELYLILIINGICYWKWIGGFGGCYVKWNKLGLKIKYICEGKNVIFIEFDREWYFLGDRVVGLGRWWLEDLVYFDKKSYLIRVIDYYGGYS